MAPACRNSVRMWSHTPTKEEVRKTHLKDRICHLCGLFVFINHSRIYLIHQTAKEFLIQKEAQSQASNNCWKHSLRPDDSETIMAGICIDYLLLKKLDSIDPESITSDEEENDICDIGALLKYSAEYWPGHLRNSPVGNGSPVLEKAYRLYQECDRYQLWFPLLWRAQRPYEHQPDMDDIRLAAFNGHDMVLRLLLENKSTDLEATGDKGLTALLWAAKLGYRKVIIVLLDNGADVYTERWQYGNALHAASAEGHEVIVRLLLDNGVDVNAQGGYFGNALQIASNDGREVIVRLLLDNKVNTMPRGGSTVMHSRQLQLKGKR